MKTATTWKVNEHYHVTTHVAAFKLISEISGLDFWSLDDELTARSGYKVYTAENDDGTPASDWASMLTRDGADMYELNYHGGADTVYIHVDIVEPYTVELLTVSGDVDTVTYADTEAAAIRYAENTAAWSGRVVRVVRLYDPSTPNARTGEVIAIYDPSISLEPVTDDEQELINAANKAAAVSVAAGQVLIDHINKTYRRAYYMTRCRVTFTVLENGRRKFHDAYASAARLAPMMIKDR